MLASLSRFVAKSAQHALSFFKLLCKEASFKWTKECEHALIHIKQSLSQTPVLSRSVDGETLFHPRHMFGNDRHINHCLCNCDLERNFLKMLERRFYELAIQLHIAEGIEVTYHVLFLAVHRYNLTLNRIL